MRIMQDFAALNRQAIAETILSEYGLEYTKSFTTVHNYIDMDRMILRKGAVSADRNETLIIPINMRDGSIICKGKGNPDWNYSAPHGAGRLYSRSQAKMELSIEEFEREMDGIYSTSVKKSTLDESPMAYKPIDNILNNVEDTVKIMEIVKPVYNFKA
jgi:RNA-splicing ligase RtcB